MAKQPITSRRRGTIVHEGAIAIVLAGVILTSVVQIMAFSAQQSRCRHQRVTAVREAGNLMEQLMARSWEQLTLEDVKAIELSEACQATLPNAKLDIDIANSDDAKQLNIEIGWRNVSGNRAAPVHLVAWKYASLEIDE